MLQRRQNLDQKKQKHNNKFINHKVTAIGIFVFTTFLIFLPFFFKLDVSHFKNLGLLGIFLLNLISSAALFFPAPVFLSVSVGGYYFNPIFVALAASLGSSLGEGVGYLFGDSGGELFDFKKRKILYFLMHTLFEKYGTLIIFLFSLIPNPFIDGIGIFAGASEYPLKKFIIVVFLGRLVRNLILATAGHYF